VVLSSEFHLTDDTMIEYSSYKRISVIIKFSSSIYQLLNSINVDAARPHLEKFKG